MLRIPRQQHVQMAPRGQRRCGLRWWCCRCRKARWGGHRGRPRLCVCVYGWAGGWIRVCVCVQGVQNCTTNIHTYRYIRTYTHTLTHAHAHVHTHRHIRTTHIHTHAHTHGYTPWRPSSLRACLAFSFTLLRLKLSRALSVDAVLRSPFSRSLSVRVHMGE